MQKTVLEQGVELMLFGMGTVFLFLALLVLVTTLMSRLVTRWAPAENLATLTSTPTSTPTSISNAKPPAQDARLLALITAAIHAHRATQPDSQLTKKRSDKYKQ